MKKKINSYLWFFLLLIVSCYACSDNEQMKRTTFYTLHLESSTPNFGEATRAASGVWQNGDVIYLLFIDGESQQIECRATYNASSQDWALDNLYTQFDHTDGSCQVYYFTSGEISSGTEGTNSLLFDEHTAIFADLSATYLVIENDIYVTARLKPQTWRLSFYGETSKPITISSTSGIESFSQFRPSAGIYGKQSKDYHLIIHPNGYTDFIHGRLSISPYTLTVIMDNKIYCRMIDNSLLFVGQSGYFKLPTESNSFGWDYGGLNSTEINLDGFFTDRNLDDTTGGSTEHTGTQDISIDNTSDDNDLDGTSGGPTESTNSQGITIDGYGPDKIF